MSSPAPFDWRSLIGPGINLGMKAVGDAVMPDASIQNARTNSKNSEVDRELALWKAQNAQQIRQQALPGMYTNLGYSPAQGRAMGANYNTAPPPPSGGSYSGGSGSPGLGSQVGRTAMNVGMSLAPTALGHILSKAGPTMVRQAVETGVPAAASVAPAAAHGVTGALGLGGGSGLLGLGAATIPVLGGAALAAGLIWKHTQAHPIADQWVQSAQNPFDQHMKALQTAGLPPDQKKQAQVQSAQNYLNSLAQFAQKGGRNAEVARNAANTFRQFYGDPMKYGIQLPF